HVARHVPDADDGDRLAVALGVAAGAVAVQVDPPLGQVVAHGHPCPPGGDAELLVVVTPRSARGEGVAQPEAVLLAQAVGQVGKGGRTSVGGHDQVRVVAVPPAGNAHDRVADHVVGD